MRHSHTIQTDPESGSGEGGGGVEGGGGEGGGGNESGGGNEGGGVEGCGGSDGGGVEGGGILRQKHRISGFGQPVRPAEALGRQGTASWPVVPSLTPLPFPPPLLFASVMCNVGPCLSTPFGRRMRVWPDAF